MSRTDNPDKMQEREGREGSARGNKACYVVIYLNVTFINEYQKNQKCYRTNLHNLFKL